MNINVATWARIIKRSQPNEHQHSNTSSLSSGGSVVRPSSLSSSTRPLPLNLITSPASVSLPPTSTSSNFSPPPLQLESHSAAADSPHASSPQENNSHKQLEQTSSEKPQHYHHPHLPHSHHPNVHPILSSGMAGTSMARPLSLSLSSPVVPMALVAGGSSNVVTSPVTPTALTSTIVPIQFPPSGKKPAPPPPPRTTSVVTIGHTTPVQPSGPPPQPVPRTYHHNTTPSDSIEDAKVREKKEVLALFFLPSLSPFHSFIPCGFLSFFTCLLTKSKSFFTGMTLTYLWGWMDGLFVCLFIYLFFILVGFA